MKELEDKICNAENSFDEMIKLLETQFLYQNIMILTINKDELTEKLREYKNQFNFAVVNNFDYELLDNTRCVVMFDEKISYTNIEICKQLNLPFVLVSKEYLSFLFFYKCDILNDNRFLGLIINNKNDLKTKKINQCKFEIDKLIYLSLNVDENIKNLFFNKGYLFNNLCIIEKQEQELNYNNYVKFFIAKKSLLLKLILDCCNNLDCYYGGFLIVQIIFNIYKNFFMYISPTILGKIKDFEFDYKKFWFVKNACYHSIMEQIEYFYNSVEKTKTELAKLNVDYYYSLILKDDTNNIKQKIKYLTKMSQQESLLKIIDNMGLLEF